jgi:hypothetical protein
VRAAIRARAGYFVGAIYLNYAFTVAVAAASSSCSTDGRPLARPAARSRVALCVLVPLCFFRYSRSLWLSLDYLVTLADERRERERLRPS